MSDDSIYALLGLPGVLLIALFLFVWTFLPFAIFGTKPILREIVEQVTLTNARLKRLEKILNQQDQPDPEE
jgi:hypothetical protein